MLVVRATNPNTLVERDVTLIPGGLNLALSEVLPEDAPVFVMAGADWSYRVLLPSVDPEQARHLGDKLVERLDGFASEAYSRARFSFLVYSIHDVHRTMKEVKGA